MIQINSITLEGHGIRLEPLAYEHHDDLAVAAADGKLWDLWFTTVPEPQQMRAYITDALAGQEAGQRLPWAVRELTSGTIIGSTRYHDIEAALDRVEIGYTWYGKSWQRSHVNTGCKLLLLHSTPRRSTIFVKGFCAEISFLEITDQSLQPHARELMAQSLINIRRIFRREQACR